MYLTPFLPCCYLHANISSIISHGKAMLFGCLVVALVQHLYMTIDIIIMTSMDTTACNS